MRRRIAKGRPVVGPDVPRDLRDFARDTLKMKWPDYVESFGIPYPETRPTRGWTKKDVLQKIRERKNAIDPAITRCNISHPGWSSGLIPTIE